MKNVQHYMEIERKGAGIELTLSFPPHLSCFCLSTRLYLPCEPPSLPSQSPFPRPLFPLLLLLFICLCNPGTLPLTPLYPSSLSYVSSFPLTSLSSSPAVMGPIEADPEYQLIVDSNNLIVEIDNEISELYTVHCKQRDHPLPPPSFPLSLLSFPFPFPSIPPSSPSLFPCLLLPILPQM